MASPAVAGFNFRVLFSAPAKENKALESGDALAAATAQEALIVPAAPVSGIRAGFAAFRAGDATPTW